MHSFAQQSIQVERMVLTDGVDRHTRQFANKLSLPVRGKKAYLWMQLRGSKELLDEIKLSAGGGVPIRHAWYKYQSDEIFTLTSLTVATGMAWFSHALGLSMALGAFMAGFVLGESYHRHKIQGYIRPFKDLLLGLFFITIGMMLNIGIVIQYWYWVLFLVMAILIFKTVVVAAVVRTFARLDLSESIQTGLILAHGGEFGFVLLSLAMQLKVMEADYGQVVLSGILITLFLCPFMVRISAPFSKCLASKFDTI